MLDQVTINKLWIAIDRCEHAIYQDHFDSKTPDETVEDLLRTRDLDGRSLMEAVIKRYNYTILHYFFTKLTDKLDKPKQLALLNKLSAGKNYIIYSIDEKPEHVNYYKSMFVELLQHMFGKKQLDADFEVKPIPKHAKRKNPFIKAHKTNNQVARTHTALELGLRATKVISYKEPEIDDPFPEVENSTPAPKRKKQKVKYPISATRPALVLFSSSMSGMTTTSSSSSSFGSAVLGTSCAPASTLTSDMLTANSANVASSAGPLDDAIFIPNAVTLLRVPSIPEIPLPSFDFHKSTHDLLAISTPEWQPMDPFAIDADKDGSSYSFNP